MGARRTALTRDIGASGLDTGRFGYSQEDFLAAWRGRQKLKNIEEMLFNSSAVGALRLSLEMPIRDIEWQFTGPEGDDATNDRGLQILNDSRDNLTHSWNDHIIDALLFPFYGWSMFSITYERVGGSMYWRKFKELGQDTVHRWLYEDDGGMAGLQQLPHLWPEPIPIERMALYRFRKRKNNPEGESILRPGYIAWHYVKSIMEIEGIGIERNLAGLPVITPPMGADMTESTSTNTDYGRAHQIARNVRQDEQGGIVLPPPMGPEEHQRWHLDLLGGGSTGSGMSKTVDTNMVISRYEKRILMTALSQFIMLGMDNVGALATFEGAADFHEMLLNACADIIAETFTAFPMPRLLALNGIDPTGYKLIHSPAGDIKLPEFSDFLAKAGSFLTWTPADEIDLRARIRAPEKTVEELEQLQEEEQQRKDDRAAMMGPPGGFPPPVAQNTAEAFAANNAPDDRERRGLELRWQRTARDFFTGQFNRVIKGAKNVR